MAHPSNSYIESRLRLPFPPEFLHDESISSWIDRLAASHRLFREDLLKSICINFSIPMPRADCDWDADPNPQVISAIEQACDLPPGRLMRQRMPIGPFTIVPKNRTCFCPRCAAMDLKRGHLPAFRRRWALAVVTHCHIHDCPLYEWPNSLQGPNGARKYDPKERGRVCAAWPKGSDPRRKLRNPNFRELSDLEPCIRIARQESRAVSSGAPGVGITWRQQVTLEQDLAGLCLGRRMSGPLAVLGSGLSVQYAIRDLYALLVEKLGPDDFWPRLPYMEMGLFPEYSWLWHRKGGLTLEFHRLRPDFQLALTHRGAFPSVRRAALYIFHQWLLQMLEMARAKTHELPGPYRDCHIAIALGRLHREPKAKYRELMTRWHPQVRQLCELPMSVEPGDDYTVKRRALLPNSDDYNPLRDAAPSLLSLAPLPNLALGRVYRSRRVKERWLPHQRGADAAEYRGYSSSRKKGVVPPETS